MLGSAPAWGAATDPWKNRGFSDPKHLVSMPENWHRMPIRHPSWAQQSDLAVTLDQQSYSFLQPIIQRYAQENKLTINVHEGTCGTSASHLIRKHVDLAGYCCPTGQTDRLPGVVFHTLGISSIAILVHADNGAKNLPLQTIRDIFRGRYFSWSKIGQFFPKQKQPGPIQTIGRLHCRFRPGHWRKLLDNSDLFSSRMGEVGAIQDMVQLVGNTPSSIGYETLWNVSRYQRGTQIKWLAIDGFYPQDDQALIGGRYPLYRVFNLAIWQGEHVANPHAQGLVDYLTKSMILLDRTFGLVSAIRLRQAGWKFYGSELVGEPPQTP